jgi:hypothetical protein
MSCEQIDMSTVGIAAASRDQGSYSKDRHPTILLTRLAVARSRRGTVAASSNTLAAPQPGCGRRSGVA